MAALRGERVEGGGEAICITRAAIYGLNSAEGKGVRKKTEGGVETPTRVNVGAKRE